MSFMKPIIILLCGKLILYCLGFIALKLVLIVLSRNLPGKKQFKCLICISGNTKCSHVERLRLFLNEPRENNENLQEFGFEENEPRNNDEYLQEAKCKSSEKISYPLQGDDITKFKYNLSGNPYPTKLIPKFNSSTKCKHENSFDSASPVSKGWVSTDKARIHYAFTSILCVVYYRPTQGNACNCILEYDGRDDHLLYLDKNNLFSYAWLFDILHNTQETRFPLAAAFRSANRTRYICGQEVLKGYMRDKLRIAYNCFIRLLDIDFKSVFKCNHCADHCHTVIMDGIVMGCPKDKMPDMPALSTDENSHVVAECEMAERVFISDHKIRKMLSTYAGVFERNYTTPKLMASSLYETLCNSLSGLPALQQVVKEAGNPCPSWLQKLVGELSRGSPTCGFIQLTGEVTGQALKILNEIASRDFTNLNTHRTLLETSCPLLIEFITTTVINQEYISDLLKVLLVNMLAPFETSSVPRALYYGDIIQYFNYIEFFPNNPQIRGRAKYGADKKRAPTNRECTKDIQTHKSLSPGLFTMFCPHGTCIGFQLMDSVESPRTSFDIFLRRFAKMPELIIYDNSCKLHLYTRKREPLLFKVTRFMVDRMHFKNHTACSEGYSMNTYKYFKIEGINSQTNEQANSQLRHLSTQAAYMTPQNLIFHVAIFFAIRNMDKASNCEFD